MLSSMIVVALLATELTTYYTPAPGMGHGVSGPDSYPSPTTQDTYGTWASSSWDKDTWQVPDPDEVEVRWYWIVTNDPNTTYPAVGTLIANQPVQQSIDTSTGVKVYNWTFLLEKVPADEQRIRYVRIKWHDTVADWDEIPRQLDGGIDDDQWGLKTVVLTGPSSPPGGGG